MCLLPLDLVGLQKEWFLKKYLFLPLYELSALTPPASISLCVLYKFINMLSLILLYLRISLCVFSLWVLPLVGGYLGWKGRKLSLSLCFSLCMFVNVTSALSHLYGLYSSIFFSPNVLKTVGELLYISCLKIKINSLKLLFYLYDPQLFFLRIPITDK